MKVRILLMGILFLLPLGASAQKEYVNEVNKFNDKGQKDGYWIEDRGADTIELYYRNGKRSGLFKSYSKNGKLCLFGEYTNGIETGTWYLFGVKGHLICINKDFKINTDTVILDNGERFVYPNKCYSISYHPNGIIADEGVLLWEEDPLLDTSREYGEWKYYDDTGKLIRTQIYK